MIYAELTIILPVGCKFNAPVDVNVSPVPTTALVFTLPPVTLPVALIRPPVNTLPPVTLAVALTSPLVRTFAPVTLPVALIRPPVNTLPCVALPVELIIPLVNTLPPVTLDVAETNPLANKLPPVKLAVPVVPSVNAPTVSKVSITVLPTPPLKIFNPSAVPTLIRPLPIV